MDKPVVVADTNILVSSNDIINELKRVLKRDFHLEEQEIDDIADSLMLFLHLTETLEKINVIKEDEKDNIILECAVSCNADHIVSGDSHLLDLKEYRGIKILSARNFLELLEKG